MSIKKFFNHSETMELCGSLADNILNLGLYHKTYPIPRGGIPGAYLLKTFLPGLEIVEKPEDAAFFIDDIIDSGYTLEKWCDEYPGIPFFALIDKTNSPGLSNWDWAVFP